MKRDWPVPICLAQVSRGSLPTLTIFDLNRAAYSPSMARQRSSKTQQAAQRCVGTTLDLKSCATCRYGFLRNGREVQLAMAVQKHAPYVGHPRLEHKNTSPQLRMKQPAASPIT